MKFVLESRPFCLEEYELGLVDVVANARRRELVLCPRGVGELLGDQELNGVTHVLQPVGARDALRGDHPGARLIFDSGTELERWWRAISAAYDSNLKRCRPAAGDVAPENAAEGGIDASPPAAPPRTAAPIMERLGVVDALASGSEKGDFF